MEDGIPGHDFITVDAAATDERENVVCGYGRIPGERLVTCGEDGLFHPTPICNGLYDISDLAEDMESAGTGRCCCDSDPSGLFSSTDEHRTNKCHLLSGIAHCSEIAGPIRWVHYTRTQHTKCKVDHLSFYSMEEHLSYSAR